ncbi:hypothetical protein [Parabacteroides sp.]
MATNLVKCNFASVFAKYETVEELKAVANDICGQVKTAFDTRVKEIKSGNMNIEVEVVGAQSEVPKTEKKTKSSKAKNDKTAGAKEMAEKFKKQEKELRTKENKDNKSDDTLIAITDTKAIEKLGLTFEKYNDKCWVLRGATKPLRKILKEQFKGVYNSRLTGGEGWVFRTASAQECADALGLNVKVA